MHRSFVDVDNDHAIEEDMKDVDHIKKKAYDIHHFEDLKNLLILRGIYNIYLN